MRGCLIRLVFYVMEDQWCNQQCVSGIVDRDLGSGEWEEGWERKEMRSE